MSTNTTQDDVLAPDDAADSTIEWIRDALAGLRFGSVELTIHDHEVVRITRTEKVRVDRTQREQRTPSTRR